MATLRDIRKRVRSLKASQKITRAMQMVAAAKLRRAQEALAQARGYVSGCQLAAARGLAAARQEARGPLPAACQQVAPGAPIVVLLGSNRGLCGPFNAQLLRWLERALQATSARWSVVPVGRKLRDPLARRRHDLDLAAPVSLASHADCAALSAQLLAQAGAEASSPGAAPARPVRVVYNHFKSVISQSVAVAELWPQLPQAEGAEGVEAATLVEPSAAELAPTLVGDAVAAGLWQAVLHGQASEQGARMTAMDAATRNARELMDALDLQYNRARQAAITRDLMDIVGGAEALAQS